MVNQSCDQHEISSFVGGIRIASWAPIGAIEKPVSMWKYGKHIQSCRLMVSSRAPRQTYHPSSTVKVPKFSMCILVPSGHAYAGITAGTSWCIEAAIIKVSRIRCLVFSFNSILEPWTGVLSTEINGNTDQIKRLGPSLFYGQIPDGSMTDPPWRTILPIVKRQ